MEATTTFEKKRIIFSDTVRVKRILRDLKLHTVCEEARCPNISECLSKPQATFMIMGDTCTRACPYCDVASGKPKPLDPNEPANLAEAVKRLGLRYVVITSVNRDDLPDGGIAHFRAVIKAVKAAEPTAKVEILTPDFRKAWGDLPGLFAEDLHVFNHNIETVEELFVKMRPGGRYLRSLALLTAAKNTNSRLLTKSGLMLGLGETKEQVHRTIVDLRKAECDIVTIGQYLQPSKQHHPVVEYIAKDLFEEYREYALSVGIKKCFAGSFVRSSYNAELM